MFMNLLKETAFDVCPGNLILEMSGQGSIYAEQNVSVLTGATKAEWCGKQTNWFYTDHRWHVKSLRFNIPPPAILFLSLIMQVYIFSRWWRLLLLLLRIKMMLILKAFGGRLETEHGDEQKEGEEEKVRRIIIWSPVNVRRLVHTKLWTFPISHAGGSRRTFFHSPSLLVLPMNWMENFPIEFHILQPRLLPACR